MFEHIREKLLGLLHLANPRDPGADFLKSLPPLPSVEDVEAEAAENRRKAMAQYGRAVAKLPRSLEEHVAAGGRLPFETDTEGASVDMSFDDLILLDERGMMFLARDASPCSLLLYDQAWLAALCGLPDAALEACRRGFSQKSWEYLMEDTAVQGDIPERDTNLARYVILHRATSFAYQFDWDEILPKLAEKEAAVLDSVTRKEESTADKRRSGGARRL